MEMDYDFSFNISFFKLTFVDITPLCCQFTMTILLVVFPIANISISIFPHISSYARFISIEKSTCIFIAVGISENAISSTFTVNIVTFVNVAILELIYTFTILVVFFPFTYIYIAISILECTFA